MKRSVIIFSLFSVIVAACAQSGGVDKSITRGEVIYKSTCQNCHLPTAKGAADIYPPLINTPYVNDPARFVNILLNGLKEPVTVGDKTYTTAMPELSAMSNRDIADVMNFVRNSFGNKGELVSDAFVKAARKKAKK